MSEALATVTEMKSKTDNPKKAPRPLVILLCCCLAFCLGLVYKWYVYSLSRETTDDAYVEAELSPVNSRMMGFISSVAVSETKTVKKGDLLATLDDSDVQIELKLKKSRVAKAKRDAGRAEGLRKSHAISKLDFENAQAMLVAAEADLEGSELKLKFTRIVSPVDGIIAKKNVQAGQFVQPGQSLFVVVPNSTPWIKANFKETQLYKVKVGQTVLVKVDGIPGHEWKGRVESIFPSTGSKLSLLPPENSTGNFTKVVQRVPVKISLTGTDESMLRAGMSAEATIFTGP